MKKQHLYSFFVVDSIYQCLEMCNNVVFFIVTLVFLFIPLSKDLFLISVICTRAACHALLWLCWKLCVFFPSPKSSNHRTKITPRSLRRCNVDVTESRMTALCRLESFRGIPTRNYTTGWGLSCTKDMSTLGLCATGESSVRVVVVMRILLQPFTSFGCHGYTAGGPSSWTPRREEEEGGKQGRMALQRGCHVSLFFLEHHLTGPSC